MAIGMISPAVVQTGHILQLTQLLFTVQPSVSRRTHTGAGVVNARATILTEAVWIGEEGGQCLKCSASEQHKEQSLAIVGNSGSATLICTPCVLCCACVCVCVFVYTNDAWIHPLVNYR